MHNLAVRAVISASFDDAKSSHEWSASREGFLSRTYSRYFLQKQDDDDVFFLEVSVSCVMFDDT